MAAMSGSKPRPMAACAPGCTCHGKAGPLGFNPSGISEMAVSSRPAAARLFIMGCIDARPAPVMLRPRPVGRRPAFGARAADGLAASVNERRVSSIADLDWPAGILAKSRPMANVMAKEDTQTTPATLGDVLYAKSKA